MQYTAKLVGGPLLDVLKSSIHSHPGETNCPIAFAVVSDYFPFNLRAMSHAYRTREMGKRKVSASARSDARDKQPLRSFEMADDFHVDIALGLSELASILAAARSAEHPLRLAPRKPLDAPLPPLLPPRTAAFYPEPAFDNFWTDGTWLAEGGRLSAYADAIISAAATIAKRDQAISHSTRHAIMVSLSELMLEPRLTMEIVRLFRPLVVDLVARWAAACVPGNTGLGDGSQIASDLSTLSLGSKTNSAVSLLGKRTRDQRSSDSGSAHAQMPTQPQISTDRLESILVALCRVLPNAPQVARFVIYGVVG